MSKFHLVQWKEWMERFPESGQPLSLVSRTPVSLVPLVLSAPLLILMVVVATPPARSQQFTASQPAQPQPSQSSSPQPLSQPTLSTPSQAQEPQTEESKDYQIQRTRKETERFTERRMVEELEMSRIRDEQRRSEILFGDRFRQIYETSQEPKITKGTQNTKISNPSNSIDPGTLGSGSTATATATATAIAIASTAGGVDNNTTVANPIHSINSSAAALSGANAGVGPNIAQSAALAGATAGAVASGAPSAVGTGVGGTAPGGAKPLAGTVLPPETEKKGETQPVVIVTPTPSDPKTGITAYFGTVDYDRSNLQGSYAAGFGIDNTFRGSPNYRYQFAFVYANADIVQKDGTYCWYNFYPRITRMEQYTGSMSLIYRILPDEPIQPFIGGIGAYTYRSYADTQLAIFNNQANSHAVDFGIHGGVDFEVSRDLSFQLDLRYFWNLMNRRNITGLKSYSDVYPTSEDRPIETISYMMILMGIRSAW